MEVVCRLRYTRRMFTVVPYDEVPASAYDAYLAAQRSALPYHSRGWLEVLHRSYGYRPVTLAARQPNGDVIGLLPLVAINGRLKGRRLVGLPFSHCVPLLADSTAVQEALLDKALALTRDAHFAYLELRTRQPIFHPNFQPSVLNSISELDLTPSLDALYAAFSQNNRRNIKKAESAGFSLRIGETARDFDLFYRLEVSTRHRQGAPIYPARFFRDVAELIGDQVRLYLLSLEGRVVAGLVIFYGNDRAVYAYGGSVRGAHINHYRPNNWLMWRAIQDAKAWGCRIFDFGTTPLHHTSLLAFKQHFRPQQHELPYWYYLHTRPSLPIINRDSRSVKLVEMGLRWLPRPLFTRLSPLLLREVG